MRELSPRENSSSPETRRVTKIRRVRYFRRAESGYPTPARLFSLDISLNIRHSFRRYSESSESKNSLPRKLCLGNPPLPGRTSELLSTRNSAPEGCGRGGRGLGLLPEKRAKDPADRGAALKRAAAIRGTRERIKRNKIKCKRALLGEWEGGAGARQRGRGGEQSRMRFYFRLNSEARPTFFLPSSSRSRPRRATLHQRRYTALSPPLLLPPSPPPPPPPSISFRKVSFSRPRHGHHGRFYHRADGIACNPRYTAPSPRATPITPRDGIFQARRGKTRSTSAYLFRRRSLQWRKRKREREREKERAPASGETAGGGSARWLP